MSDRVAVFQGGKIQQLSTPRELYERPRTSFVARFIGENNQLLGTLREKHGDACVVEVDGGFAVKGTAVNVGEPGERASVSIRPESVNLAPATPSGSADLNAFQATVRDVVFLGDHVRLRVNVCGNDDFIVKLRRTPELNDIRIGQVHSVTWSAEESLALDAPG